MPSSPARAAGSQHSRLSIIDQLNAQLQKLDKDGDGNLTLEEIESSAKDGIQKASDTLQKVYKLFVAYELYCRGAIGGVATFYGGHFTHMFLAFQAFQSAEASSTIKANFLELIEVAKETRAKFVREAGGQHATLLKLNGHLGHVDMKDRMSVINAATETVNIKALLAGLKCVDPQRVADLVKSMYGGVLVALCTTMNDNAAKLGMGLHFGERVSNFLISLFDKLEEQYIKRRREASGAALPSAGSARATPYGVTADNAYPQSAQRATPTDVDR